MSGDCGPGRGILYKGPKERSTWHIPEKAVRPGAGAEGVRGKEKGMGIPDHPTCPLRNLYAGQEATV